MAQYDGSTRKVLSWNMKVGRDHKQALDGLGTLIKNTKPDAVALQEAKGYVGDLRDRYGDDWYIYAHNDWAEANDNPVMVWKGDHNKKTRGNKDGWDTLRTHTKWKGPQGGTHNGRTWTWVRIDGLWVMSFHRCTDGKGSNKDAFIEEHDKVVKWIGNHTPCLVIGDHNCGSGADFPGSSRRIKEHAKGGIDASGTIDYAIQKDANGGCVLKAKQGSDHKAVLWTLGG